jgi:tRNA A-37 threonylcarbamoyl transferase component Bud32
VSHATRPGLPGAGQSGTIAGYRLDGYVGQGSSAVVYRAQDERLHRQVALKVMTPELAGDAAFRTRMVGESRAAAALGHPHIVPVFQAGETDGTLYAAMRYLSGGDGRSLLSRHGPFPIGYAWRIVAQIASALDAAHAQGLIHRDVRPANILLDGDDAGDRAAGVHAYLSDFGMSRVFPPGQVIAPDQAAGILDYLAPEQIEGRDLDGRADQYALACTGFEFLCGTPPFAPDQGQTLMYAQIYADPPAASVRRAGIPAAVDSVLATALAKNPADRYPSCGRFAAELRAALGARPGEPGGPPPRSPAPHGIVPVSEPRPAMPGRVLLRVKQRPPGTEGGQAPAKDPPAVATDRPAGAGSLAPVPAWEPATAGKPATAWAPAPAWEPAPAEEAAPAGDPGGPDPEPPARRTWSRRPVLAGIRARGPVLAAGAAVVVAAAVVSGVALSGRSAPAHPAATTPAPTVSSPSPPPSSPSASTSPSGPVTASQQAAALSTLLTSSAAARTALHNAVTQVGSCTNLSGAVRQLQAVVNQRAGQAGRASALPTAALPGGTEVKSKLMTALDSSLTADRDYLSWARQQLTGGCTPTSQSSAYNAAFTASQRADAAKQAFVQVWNPVAARYGIAQESPRDI